MSKVTIIGENGDAARSLAAAAHSSIAGWQLTMQSWKSLRGKHETLANANVLLLDLTDPDAPGPRAIRSLLRQQPERLLLLAQSDATHFASLARLLEQPTVDFTRAADVAEIMARLNRLMQQNRARIRQTRQTADRLPDDLQRAAPSPASALPNRFLVSVLHDPHSGRLDARRVADFYAMGLTDVARALGVSLSRLHKTPASAFAQQGLAVFERIAAALLCLAGSPENARVWLCAPDPQLEHRTPLSLLVDGRGQIVAEMLDDMLTGQPS